MKGDRRQHIFTAFFCLLMPIRIAFSGDSEETKFVPELVLGEPRADGVRSMDALLRLDHGGVVLDPFFRAPGLDFASVLIHRGDDKKLIQVVALPGCSTFYATTAQEFSVGSLDAPLGAIVGSRFWLQVSDPEKGRTDKAELNSYYASLVRYKSPKKEGVRRTPDDVDTISEPVLIGEFWSPRFNIYSLGYVESAQRLKATAGVPVVPELKIHSNAYGTTFHIRFVNLSEESLELFSPFLNETAGGNSPVQLWVRGVRDGEEFTSDFLDSGFGKYPRKRMSIKVPAGAIVGNSRRGRLAAGDYKAQFIVKDLFLTRDLPFDVKYGVFSDFNPATAKTILTTPEVTFTVP